MIYFADHDQQVERDGEWDIELASDDSVEPAAFTGRVGPEQALLLRAA